jgi:ATP-dependent Clp protease adapter protein ClpS
MYRVVLVGDDVNTVDTMTYALRRVFGWPGDAARSYADRVHVDGFVALADTVETVGAAEELASRLLMFGLLPRIEVR